MSSATQPNLTSFTVRPAVDLAVPSICCLVCSGTEMLSYLPGLLRCENCGFVSADLSISDEELRALYSADYFHGNEYLDYIAEAQSLRLNFRNRLPVLRHLLPAWSEADLLEIGCAYGFFLEEVRNEVRSACGIDVCRVLKDDPVTAGMRVVILTAEEMPAVRERAAAAGADAFVAKPFRPTDLLALVRRLLPP